MSMAGNLKAGLLRLVPPRHQHALVNLKNTFFGGYANTHYSQFGEDIVVGTLLRSKEGFYVDVGANHPKRYSNTALLYERGWRGLNIDANPPSVALFRHARTRDINIERGVGKEHRTLPFYQFSDPAMNTFSDEVAEGLKNKRWLHLLGTRLIEVEPLREILDTHLPQDQKIDFMNIDVEGMDMEVLESNDWERFAPTVIAIEAHNFDAAHPAQHPVFQFLSNRGYTLRATMGPTLIFWRSLTS